MSTTLHRISSGVLAGLQYYDEEERISEGHNRMSSRVPDGIQIYEEEKMSESHCGDSIAATGFDDAATKELIRKLDLRLIPILATIYLVCFLDRANVALFFSMATAAGAFGGLFARGISDMSGVGGRNGWSWIFIIEGLLTFCVGCISYWVIGDYPNNAKFLSETERKEVMRRLAIDRDLLSDEWNSKYVWQALKDWKIYVNMVLAFCLSTTVYSLSLFLPTIVKEMGYTNNAAQLMSVPPYVVACFFTISASFVADKMKQRGYFILGYLALGITGSALLISSDKTPVQYTGAFLAALGAFPTIPLLSTWVGNNLSGSLKRGVGFGMVVGFGNFGVSFIEGHSIFLSLLCFAFVLTALMMTYYKMENNRRDARDAERGLTADTYTLEMKLQQKDEGDNATFWRYTI
ncbi:high-affinity nicotinic acid transporter [Botrytis cinerea]